MYFFKVLLRIRGVFMSALSSNSSHIKSCERLILKLSEFLSSKEDLIAIFENFKVWKNISRYDDTAPMQDYKIFLKTSADSIIQYIKLASFVEKENKLIMNFNCHANTNPDKKLGVSKH